MIKLKPRTRPSTESIVDYWFLYLVGMGQIPAGEAIELADVMKDGRLCFACGRLYPENTDRCQAAHIRARTRGGSDEVKNFHLLCKSCHRESEYLFGVSYWLWFRWRRPNWGFLSAKRGTLLRLRAGLPRALEIEKAVIKSFREGDQEKSA